MKRFSLITLFLLPLPTFALSIQTIAGDEQNGAMANSVLLIGDHEVFLVDTQQTVNNARKVVAAIQKTGKPLTTVFFTHAHSDHILGAAVLKEAFPAAQFKATAGVALEIAGHGEKLRQLFIKILADAHSDDHIADSIVIPEALSTEKEFYFDGTRLKIIEMASGESETSGMIYLPDLGTLISGDVVYHEVHLWLRDGKFKEWTENLQKVSMLPHLKMIYPGHGEPTDRTIIKRDLQYIQDFKEAVRTSSQPQEALLKMEKRYPTFKVERILRLSLSTHFPKDK